MTRRARHLAEMRHALAHGCSLAQARQALADLRSRAIAAVRAHPDPLPGLQAERDDFAYRRTHFGYEP